MKRRPLLFAIAITLLASGCVSNPAEDAAMQAREANLNNAQSEAVVGCSSNESCNKAFSLAKVYVSQNADMKIQQADDTMVSTYSPTQWEFVGLQATKVPGNGETATIELAASCKGTWLPLRSGQICEDKMLSIYRGFKPFIESRLK